jgi:amino acid adenylation domain-containing protein/non-ribosomal peptide synthase protein (TIGR01720 family)
MTLHSSWEATTDFQETDIQKDDIFLLPTSFAQARLWFLDQFEPGSPFYNIPAAVRLTGKLNVVALQQSLNEMVQRHEALRTTFAVEDGQPVQVIRASLTLNLPIVDLTALPIAEREAEIFARANAEIQQPFDLTQVPLWRVTLLRLDEADHVLLLTMHHIISDGWSLGVFLREMAALYEAFSNGNSSPLSELPIQYADFAVWQRDWLQGKVLETQLNYWKQQLSGSLPVLQLPSDRPRPAIQSYTGKKQFFVLSKTLTVALKSLSQQTGVTLFMTMLAAFKTLAHRYTNQDDLIVGSAIANRNRAEVEGLIGLFVNTLVLRTDLSGNPTFKELLNRVREVTLGAYAHQDLPFEKLVEELQPERDLSQNPLFQVWFALNNAPMPAMQLASGLTLTPLEVDSGTAHFDLSLDMVERGEELIGSFEYNTDLFDATTISRMVGHFQTLLEGIVADCDRPLSHLPLLTEAERHQLLVQWNDTQANYPQNLCIHQLFEAQVEKTPDAVAVVFENHQLTYAELNAKANKLAHHLQKLGVKPEVLVGICVERSLEMIVGILGILKAGGAYVPLDPAYPPERLAFMLSDTQVPVLLTQHHLLKSLPQHEAKFVCLDADWDLIAQDSTHNPLSKITAENLAYIIYTSGSTGKAKGVMIQHSSLVNIYLAWEETYQLRAAQSCHLQMANFSFDVFTGDFVRALCSGGKLVLCPRELLLEPPKLYELMLQEKVNCAEFVPAVLSSLIKYLEANNQRLNFMRLLICGSDSWYVREYEKLRQFGGSQTRIINSFGLTEATIDNSYFEGTANLSSEQLVPIGRPFTNTQLYILDSHLQPLPIGIPGELYVGGAGLARGYLNRPELTQEKFIPNPFSNEPPRRRERREGRREGITFIYKTGDLARFLPDGNIEFIGRIDYQVKIRGYRIELGEIEGVLSQHPAVREAVVLAGENEPGNQRLIAYIVSNISNVELGETHGYAPLQDSGLIKELRSFLKEKLPHYMVPSAFVLLETLPLTPNGKLDRRSLPAPDPTRSQVEAAYTAPQTTTEEVLVRVWSQALGVEKIGIHDNFFELGGDSILSLQIISKARDAGLQLTPKQIFQYQTIAELAAVAGTTQTTIEAEQGIVTGTVFLTPIQQWFFEQNLLDAHHWNQAVLLETRQKLDVTWLEKSVQVLLKHHDSLRLRFVKDASGWQQFYADVDDTNLLSDKVGWVEVTKPNQPSELGFAHAQPNLRSDVIKLDFSNLSETQQKQAIEDTANELQASLNLSEGSLIRVALFELGDNQPNRLLIVIHHLAVDGVSWRVLLEDLQRSYEQISQGKCIQLPAKTTSFKQWSEQLREYANSAKLKQELNYWLTELQKPISRLPVGFANGINTMATAQTVSVSLSQEETQALLQEVPKVYNTQINDVLLTALGQAFSQWTGMDSVLVDLEGHGRETFSESIDLSRTVGWFTSVFPVLLNVGKNSQHGEALKAVKEQLRRIPNRGFGYGALRYLSSEEVALALKALPQAEVAFNYLGQFDQSLPPSSLFKIASESTGNLYSPRGSRAYLLEINGLVAVGQLRLEWSFSEAVHRRETVQRLAEGYIEALRSLIAHCQSPEAGGYTPSDFIAAKASTSDFDKLLAQISQSTKGSCHES